MGGTLGAIGSSLGSAASSVGSAVKTGAQNIFTNPATAGSPASATDATAPTPSLGMSLAKGALQGGLAAGGQQLQRRAQPQNPQQRNPYFWGGQ